MATEMLTMAAEAAPLTTAAMRASSVVPVTTWYWLAGMPLFFIIASSITRVVVCGASAERTLPFNSSSEVSPFAPTTTNGGLFEAMRMTLTGRPFRSDLMTVPAVALRSRSPDTSAETELAGETTLICASSPWFWKKPRSLATYSQAKSLPLVAIDILIGCRPDAAADAAGFAEAAPLAAAEGLAAAEAAGLLAGAAAAADEAGAAAADDAGAADGAALPPQALSAIAKVRITGSWRAEAGKALPKTVVFASRRPLATHVRRLTTRFVQS